jgi:hypothetical protein
VGLKFLYGNFADFGFGLLFCIVRLRGVGLAGWGFLENFLGL